MSAGTSDAAGDPGTWILHLAATSLLGLGAAAAWKLLTRTPAPLPLDAAHGPAELSARVADHAGRWVALPLAGIGTFALTAVTLVVTLAGLGFGGIVAAVPVIAAAGMMLPHVMRGSAEATFRILEHVELPPVRERPAWTLQGARGDQGARFLERNLDAAGLEVANVLLADGYEGTLGGLVDVTRAVTSTR